MNHVTTPKTNAVRFLRAAIEFAAVILGLGLPISALIVASGAVR